MHAVLAAAADTWMHRHYFKSNFVALSVCFVKNDGSKACSGAHEEDDSFLVETRIRPWSSNASMGKMERRTPTKEGKVQAQGLEENENGDSTGKGGLAIDD